MKFSLLIAFTAWLMLFAGLDVSATQTPRLDGFQLLDQNGTPAGIAPSKNATLIYFYRGDW